MFEVYRTQIIVKFASKRSTSTFFHLVDNTTFLHPHRVASELNQQLWVVTDWGLYFTEMLSNVSRVQMITTRKIRPTPGASAQGVFTDGTVPGLWPGQCAENFLTANLMWHFPGDQTGNHQVRISPLGAGAWHDTGWFPLFKFYAASFITNHLAVKVLFPGVTAQGCINHQTSGGTLITSGVLSSPPGRQRNRRWSP